MDPIIILCKELELHKNKFWHYIFKILKFTLSMLSKQANRHKQNKDKKTSHLFREIKQKSLLNLLTFI